MIRKNKNKSYEFKFDSSKYLMELESFENIPVIASRKLKLCKMMLAFLMPFGIVVGYFIKRFSAVFPAYIILTVIIQVSYFFYRKTKKRKEILNAVDIIAIAEFCTAAGMIVGAVFLLMIAMIIQKYV